MPDTMIERMARVLFWMNGGGAWVDACELTKLKHRKEARAVLEELREPTEAMDTAGRAAVRDDGVPGWTAMIDAALAEGA